MFQQAAYPDLVLHSLLTNITTQVCIPLPHHFAIITRQGEVSIFKDSEQGVVAYSLS